MTVIGTSLCRLDGSSIISVGVRTVPIYSLSPLLSVRHRKQDYPPQPNSKPDVICPPKRPYACSPPRPAVPGGTNSVTASDGGLALLVFLTGYACGDGRMDPGRHCPPCA